MQLENNFKKQNNIRQKAYKVDNPLQAKRSSGYEKITPLLTNSEGVQLLTELWEGERAFSPELRFACKGLSPFKTFGLIFENII